MSGISLINAYFKYGSEGLTESGKKEGLKRIRVALQWSALAIMAIALAVIILLCFTVVIPGHLPARYYIATTFLMSVIGLIAGSIPASVGISAIIRAHRSVSQVLTAEERASFIHPQKQTDELYQQVHENL